jgi:hypothetical protein
MAHTIRSCFIFSILLIASSLRRLASFNGCSKYIGVLSVVISELEFRDVQMQIFLADLVVGPHNAALQDRPKALDCVRVDRADDMLANAVVNDAMRETIVQPIVARPSIGAEQANAGGNGLSDKPLKDRAAGVCNDARDDVALSPNCADYGSLAGIAAPSHADFLVPMPVSVVAADIGFVHFNDPAQLLNVLNEGGPDLVAHKPSGLVRAETHIAVDLEGAHSLLADQHQVRDSEPILEGLIRVLKDCAGQVREAIAGVRGASVALPMPRIALQLGGSNCAAARATDAFWPAARDQVSNAIVLGLKERIELLGGQLVNGFWTAAHSGLSPSMEGTFARSRKKVKCGIIAQSKSKPFPWMSFASPWLGFARFG